MNTDGFLRAYRDAREITTLPVPTMPYSFENVLYNLNNPPQANTGEIAAAQARANAAAADAAAATAAAAAAAANATAAAAAATAAAAASG